MANRVVILDHHKIEQKIKRIAYEIYESNVDISSIVLAGIDERGYELALRIKNNLEQISDIKVSLYKIINDRSNHITNISILPEPNFKDSVVVVVDDVMDSGRTLMHAVKKMMDYSVIKINTAVLVDRSHHQFPIYADFVGISLATTLQEHIHVEFSNNNDVAYLI